MRQKWNKDKVISSIKTMHSNGAKLNGDSVQRNNTSLYSASRRMFGSWRNAIEESGINYSEIQKHKPNEIKVLDKTKEITVFKSNGSKKTIIIDKDICLPEEVHICSGYGQMKINRKNIKVHHYVYGKPKSGHVIDHINRNKLDCRRENLREIDFFGNTQNRKAKGYRITENGRYRAQIRADNKVIHLGTFDTEQEASQAYLEAKLKYHRSYIEEEN
ncbi:HNH endonuclease [Bacillus toyonensis]|uniref:HNH endonuclease n=1 Tax=Bacillus toyonensis TaxID=155322 RepID=UPI000BF07694|nr:HNH endonuclease [Bacillus toyonensis]PEM64429.1 hypothetical protein CN625_01580 [Bacillus toyonensis]